MGEDAIEPKKKGINTTVIIIVIGVVIALASLIAYFPDINLPGGYVFRFIEPVRREYAKTILGLIYFVFIQLIVIAFYVWLLKSVFPLFKKIRTLLETITSKIEGIMGH